MANPENHRLIVDKQDGYRPRFARSLLEAIELLSSMGRGRVRRGLLFFQNILRTAIQPGINLTADGQHRAAALTARPSHGKPQITLPPLHGADTTLEISGDFLPGIENVPMDKNFIHEWRTSHARSQEKGWLRIRTRDNSRKNERGPKYRHCCKLMSPVSSRLHALLRSCNGGSCPRAAAGHG